MLSIIFAGALVAAFLFMFGRQRIWILCLFLCVYGVLKVMAQDETVDLSWSQLLLFRALYPILLLSAIIRYFRDSSLYKQAANWPLFLFSLYIASVLSSCLYSDSRHVFDSSSHAFVGGFLTFCLLFLLSAAHIQTPQDFTKVAVACVFTSISLAMWVLWTTAHLNFQAFRGGVEVNQNYVSLFVLAGAIPLLHALFNLKGFWLKASISGLLFSILAASMLLISRGVIIAFVASAIVMTPQLMPKHKFKAFAVLALLLCLSLLIPGVVDSLARFNDADVASGNGRTVIWSYSLKRFADSGIFHVIGGVGYNSASFILPSAMEPGSWNYHNEYLNILMDGGLLGLSIFLLLLWSIWRKIAQSEHPLRNVMRGWFVFLVVAGFTGVVSGVQLYWVLLGSISGAVGAQKWPATVRSSRTLRNFYSLGRRRLHETISEELVGPHTRTRV